jgi:hypothetical protein
VDEQQLPNLEAMDEQQVQHFFSELLANLSAEQ